MGIQLYRKKNKQNPYMINKSQRCETVTLLKSLKLVPLKFYQYHWYNYYTDTF